MHLPVIEDLSLCGKFCKKTSQAESTDQDRGQEASDAIN